MTSRAVFSGWDASGYINLWVTDGTAAGTSELSPAGAYHYGLLGDIGDPDFTALNGSIVFQGIDASGHDRVWVTDGTSAGTSDLPATPSYSAPDFTVVGSKAFFAALGPGRSDLWVTDGTAGGTSDLTAAFPIAPGPSDLTVLGDKVLFFGSDPLGRIESNAHGAIYALWVTDGTSAGTAGFLNAANPVDITSIGDKAVFAGSTLTLLIITYGVSTPGLFVTDGTAAGTHELAVSGASSGGLFSLPGLDPDITALGSKALFVGEDASDHPNLWITDGSSAGTSELTVAGAFSGGLFSNLLYDQEPDFTVLGAKAVFLGADASGHPNLWVTDGTSVGTNELTVAGAYSRGLFFELDPHFIVLGDKVLFVGADPTGRHNLWITDGTSAGTHELAIAGTPELYPDGFAVVGNKVLFEGVEDETGKNVLWITDGTSAGTSEVAVPGAYTGGSGLNPIDITAIPPPPAPVTIATNGVTSLVQIGNHYELEAVSSGTGPFLTYGGSTVTVGEFPGWTPVGAAKTATGYEVAWSLGANEYSVWNTDNNGAYTGAATGALSGASYALQKLETSFSEDLNGDGTIGPTLAGPPAAPHDFNNDGLSDILWQSTSGQASIWDMSGSTLAGGGAVSPNPGPSWRAVGTGDFNDDGDSDLLWQNASTGQASIWDMDGTNLLGGGAVSPNPGPSWKAIGTGDFNGDGFADDILWQNTSTGQASIWEMDGKTLLGGGAVTPNPGPAWKAIGTGDFNKDGDADILWQNASSGQVSIWEMDGSSLIGGGAVSPNPGPSWKAIGTGDFNDDGRSDILFQNVNSGQVSIWEMNANALTGGGAVSPNSGPSWRAVGTGDFNGDGFSDILFQNASGQASIWDMNGNTIIGGGPITANPGPSWRAVGAT